MKFEEGSELIKTTMLSIFKYASNMEATSSGGRVRFPFGELLLLLTNYTSEMRSVALGLMLVVATSVGSVEMLLGTIEALARGAETLVPSVLGIFEGAIAVVFGSILLIHVLSDLNSIKTDLLLSLPTAKV